MMFMTLLLFFDYLGVFVFAMTGALVAARKGMDIFGFVVLAMMPAVGGGTIRDLILDVPVFWLTDTWYLFITLAAAILTFATLSLVHRLGTLLVWLDALGLAVFCAIGTMKALEVTGDPVVGVMMGVITAVAGGILRDVIANESPLVLHREVYATAAFLGSVTCVAAITLQFEYPLSVAIITAFIVRALGITFGLSLPGANPPDSEKDP